MNKIKFIFDKDVDKELNNRIINILTESFPHETKFQTQRYCYEKPLCRWYLEEDNEIAAHLALHDKQIHNLGKNYKIGGIAEVCVKQKYRGRGYAKELLNTAHNYLFNINYDYSLLFGKVEIYSSSGYKRIKNKIKFFDLEKQIWITVVHEDAMYKKINNTEWLEGIIDLKGPIF